jgi:4-aminobutyrate aminotransferase-like enzyme
MLAVELKDTPDYALTTRVHRELIQRGFITCRRPGVSVLRLDPALTIDRADIAAFLTALEETLAEAPPTP